MRANIIYILMAAGILASCTDSMETGNDYLNGNQKTPIAVKTTLSAAPLSRAFDKTFESGDKLFAYIEAGKLEASTFTPVAEEGYSWKGSFSLTRDVTTTTDEGKGEITSTTEDSDLSPVLYWDDFSSTDYDLREEDRGIRLKYGYCYNEGDDNASDYNETDGTLTWTVQSDQSDADGTAMKHSDLLYAATQPMIKYGHNSRGTLVLPYTHAMSKVTINIKTGEGYATTDANFASSVLTLNNMQVRANVNAPAATVTVPEGSPSGIANITAFNKSKANTNVTYQAIIGPTTLTNGNILATITNVGGNNTYNIPITDAILTAWKAEDKLIECEEVIDNGIAQAKPTSSVFASLSRAKIDLGKSYITKPGIHYILDVTVDKQKITIRATITDWDNVKAEGRAAINFAGDVTEKGTIATELQTNGFDVYKSNSSSAFSQKSTTVTFTSGEWKYTPAIYWAGQADNSYFRAISPAGASASALTQGVDLMWGTSGDAAISPRTGDVKLDFEHLMSKLCVKLETTTGASSVDLNDATISITKLATSGSYSIVNGTVSAGSAVETMLSGKANGFTETVVPQAIGDDARLIITLADGTTYSLQLNKCVDSDSTSDPKAPVTAWTKGNSYTYTIHLEKETVTFRAIVKNWVEAEGNGNATLEWD